MPPVPMRTCVGCRARASKAELLRIVRAPEGDVRPDPSGSAAGRGAYVHRDRTCVGLATARGALARALRTGLGKIELARLESRIEEAMQER